MPGPEPILAQLARTIEDRRRNPPAKSYTTWLLAGGTERIGGKVLEEAAEVVEAAAEPGEPGQQHLVAEAADVVYHLMVLLAHRDVSFAQVEAELERRFGTSGIDEKQSRPPKQ